MYVCQPIVAPPGNIPVVEMSSRPRYPKGEGDRLRTDLLDAAADLLGTTGDIVSLRAIAARAGVSPTAVYRHFDDHGELLQHAVAHCWREFERALAVAAASSDDPFLAFRAAGDAYLAFAREQPGKYRVLFSNKVDLDGGRVDLGGGTVDLDLDEGVGVAAFDHLVGMVTAMLDANDDGRDPYFVAVQVHTWIHGMVDLTGRHPAAEWPPLDALLDDLAVRLGLVAPSTGSG